MGRAVTSQTQSGKPVTVPKVTYCTRLRDLSSLKDVARPNYNNKSYQKSITS